MSKDLKPLLSTGTDDWCTPADMWPRILAWAGGAVFDPCKNPHSAYPGEWTERDDALARFWPRDVPVYCNPPYSDVGTWIRKSATEAALGSTLLLLIPARPDTAAWQDTIAETAHEVCFLRGRLRFTHLGVARDAAPFPSALVRWGGQPLGDFFAGWCVPARGKK